MAGRYDKAAPQATTEHMVTPYHPYRYHDNHPLIYFELVSAVITTLNLLDINLKWRTAAILVLPFLQTVLL
jgi:hypothetical protein